LWAPQSEFYSEKRLLSEDIGAYVHYKAPLNQTAGDKAKNGRFNRAFMLVETLICDWRNGYW
jgi:hypothetical protein